VSNIAPIPTSGVQIRLPSDMRDHDGPSGVIVGVRAGLSLCSVLVRNRGQRDFASRLLEELKIVIPLQARHVSAGPLAFAWAGPSQWLAIADSTYPAPLASTLKSILGDSASVIDQSDGRTVVRVGGSRVSEALAKGLLIDLHPATFTAGSTAVTSVSYMGVHVWRPGAALVYDFAVFRSYAQAFCDWLVDASAEYGVSIADPDHI
jgi:methylglutamate dehydrogenase subunit D